MRGTGALKNLAVMGNQLISLDAPHAPVFGVTAVDVIARIARAERRAERRRSRRHQLLDIVRAAVVAADQIASYPYRWGGGHGSFTDSGYDCSGSVSYVLHGAGQLAAPMSSIGLMGYGEPGPGRLITVYTSPGHAFMVIRGRRYDTSGQSQTGTRWQPTARSTAGFVARHPSGL
jgi:cell wall-associated NlpC family hydrolase